MNIATYSSRRKLYRWPIILITVALVAIGVEVVSSLVNLQSAAIVIPDPVLEYTDAVGQPITVNLAQTRNPGDTIPFPKSGKLSVPIPDTVKANGAYRRIYLSWTSDGMGTCHYKHGTEDISIRGTSRPHITTEIYSSKPCSPRELKNLIDNEGYREPGLNSLWRELLDHVAWFID